MMDKHKAHVPQTGRPPLSVDIEKARARKTRIELEENEDLEVDEGTEATAGGPNPRTIPALNARWSNRNPNSMMRQIPTP